MTVQELSRLVTNQRYITSGTPDSAVWEELLHNELRMMGALHFMHFSPVSGSESSIRILSAFEFTDSVQLPRPKSSSDVAYELAQLLENGQARFPVKIDPKTQRGWRVYTANLDGVPVITFEAVWCKAMKPASLATA